MVRHKTCSICGVVKPITSYYRNKRQRDGYQAHCKLCHKNIQISWYEKNREKVRKATRESVARWRKNHPGESRRRSREYNAKHKPERARYRKQRYVSLKRAVFAHYGLRCQCCGETDWRFLCIDHTYSNGREHRKTMGRAGGETLFRWIIAHNYPSWLQLLCFNCNLGRQFFGGPAHVCPHKLTYEDMDTFANRNPTKE